MSRLSHLFKHEMGTNVKNYRLDCRLQVGAALLLSTGTPIKEIAYSAGYHHTSSFARAFKTRFGSSPACYRSVTTSWRGRQVSTWTNVVCSKRMGALTL